MTFPKGELQPKKCTCCEENGWCMNSVASLEVNPVGCMPHSIHQRDPEWGRAQHPEDYKDQT
eukprot:CAMPEP_0174322748 /NCGR_PEP_ID=MMETSP0810-20121108/11242_1 /TAXON_ID=73025 ORGANISM="Eutreptiella gymnastica-like, Strain CCMP1594" /NCGR_SAMPLE_ID=MMETSP0810 /ASSEMBLY_ACC=CAM_ASM_000659 /LENGTH=61 /DNA_ID=CAMNT_0015434735 /DNA_START=456 /DNA_END=641 /DNA_ORIENTATION=+